MSFPAYPSYKDSGVEWLGEVPIDWQVKRLRELISLVNGYPFDAARFSPDHGVPLIRIRDLNAQQAAVRFDGDVVEAALVTGRDLLIGMDGDFNVGRWLGQGPALLNQRVCCLRGDARILRMLEHALPIPLRLINDLTYSTTVKHLSSGQVLDVRVALPPSKSELTSLVEFLDRETAKIDALIKEQRRLIALLKEKRRAVISHAVTKGLDPHAPMKDSGIEWLGEVPAHWTMRPIKAVVKRIEQGWSPQCDAEPVERSEQWGVLKVGCVNGGVFSPSENKALPPELEPRPEFALRAGDLLISRANTRELVGSAAVVERDYDRLLLCDKLYRLSVDPAQTTPEYLASYLQSDVARGQIEVAASGASSSMLNIGQSVIREMPIATPSLTEQRKIVAHLQRNRSMFDALIYDAQSAIALLVERRAALISAAVTGKIDVRCSAKALPFPIERARARALVGTEIIERSAGQPTFGRVKFQKLAFLAEGHVGIRELAGRYTRAAAGPLDGALIDDMERGAHSMAGVTVDQAGGTGTTVSYRLGQQHGGHRQELADWLGPDRTAKLDKLIADFAPLKTQQAEAVATLYGVWNDLLSEGASPSDDEIITGFLNDWHPEKREKFRAGELADWLGWMRRHGIVPTGSGPKTTTGRLFV